MCAPHVLRAAERHYRWWEDVWDAAEARSRSSRGSVVTATVEYGPVEIDGCGENVGYTPLGLDGRPVAGVEHEACLGSAAEQLRRRFEAWHADTGRRMRT